MCGVRLRKKDRASPVVNETDIFIEEHKRAEMKRKHLLVWTRVIPLGHLVSRQFFFTTSFEVYHDDQRLSFLYYVIGEEYIPM